ncbi:unnamed protein product [Rhizoctonia solani]|uniref:Uncharacterized protein n=1 Tax=Rhizoctonia solani TaxID=456999 RepID=A0A8H3CVY5_9AGAM|nr:unnamed protein product [Rhizoctonia solani]CAE7201200.1 unnamed protein product [Rhizoctonia solani]
MEHGLSIDKLLWRTGQRYNRRLFAIKRHHRIATLMARHRIQLQQQQFPASAAQLDIRLALRLLDICESTAKKHERNRRVFLFRIDEINDGRLTYLSLP